MSTKATALQPKAYYWVKTEGYHQKHTPLYHSTDGWRVEINDKTVFISTYKLELLFGKGCVKEMVMFEADRAKEEKKNAFLPYVIDTEDEHDAYHVVLYNPVVGLALINGMLAPIDVKYPLAYPD